MRYVEKIHDLWTSGGPFLGEDRPSGRVTVERNYWLRSTESASGRNQRNPYRWFQRADTDEQFETEIPNVKSITIERDLNGDAATCRIVIANTVNLKLGEREEQEGVWGKPGYFSYSRGLSQEAKARWGQSANEWSKIIVPNALLRTYHGYGGHDKTIPEAVADEDIIITGVWLIDEIRLSANSDLELSCRDMGKFLIDQQLYPPLMPGRLYPLEYYRWKYDSVSIPKGDIPASSQSAIGLPCHYGCTIGGSASSSTDVFYGFDANILGHQPSHAFDSSFEPDGDEPGKLYHQQTFWLSNGHSSPDGYEWIEICCDGQETNKVYIHPWGGDYVCYVSVWENGGWVSPEGSGEGGTIPYAGGDYTGVNAADIPYVTKLGLKWEAIDREAEHPLPRVYKADKIRLTFTNLTASQWESPNHYRAGVRKTFPMFDMKEAVAKGYLNTYACASYPKVDEDAVGYWQVRHNGNVFAFGDARLYPASNTNPETLHASWVVAMYANHDGLGYWTMDMNGRVVAYGSASHYGDRSVVDGSNGYTGFAPTPTGNGYWLLRRDGQVFAYGDAVDHGSSSHVATLPTGVRAWAHAIESHPDDSGYWVLWTDGYVDAFELDHLGDADRDGFDTTEYVGTLKRDSAGTGYWIVSGGGKIQQFGTAFNFGGATAWGVENWTAGLVWDFLPNWNTDSGYAFQRANGDLDIRGDFEYFGSCADGTAILRKDGNYKDYSDIIRELVLWSGFHLYDPENASADPEVYGRIEKTGAYAKEDLPREMFDKKPVIDPITELKEVVGYIVWVDQQGRFRFESPNWWSLGNYDYEMVELDLIPVVDEMVQLLDYSVVAGDRDARSELMISTAEPTEDFTDTLTTRIVPASASLLRGMVKPAQWINGAFLSKKEQEIMAELISMHAWFAERMGSVTCWGNPLIDINDQIRIYERTTGETFVHYVRGVSSTIDNESGEYTMTIDTNWLGGSPLNRRPLFLAAEARRDGTGYWQARNDGSIYAFGDADLFPTDETHRNWVTSIRSSATGEGYYTLDLSGKVIARGDAVHYGDLNRVEEDCMDMAVTPSGEGYVILSRDGTVEAFGDAVNYGNATLPMTPLPSGDYPIAQSIEHHSTDGGYWILTTDGTVHEFGACVNHGSANRDSFLYTEYVASLRSTSTGDGYWIVSGGGRIQAFGDASDEGESDLYPQAEWVDGLVWAMIPNYAGTGYAIQHADGQLDFFGDMENLGEAFDTGAPVSYEWRVVDPTIYASLDADQQREHFSVSGNVTEFMSKLESPSAQKAVASKFDSADVPPLKA